MVGGKLTALEVVPTVYAHLPWTHVFALDASNESFRRRRLSGGSSSLSLRLMLMTLLNGLWKVREWLHTRVLAGEGSAVTCSSGDAQNSSGVHLSVVALLLPRHTSMTHQA